MQSFAFIYAVSVNKLLNKQSSYWLFEMSWHSCDIIVMESLSSEVPHNYVMSITMLWLIDVYHYLSSWQQITTNNDIIMVDCDGILAFTGMTT